MTEHLEGAYGITELSQAYGVSRKTVYKWSGRYEKDGWLGLEDRSRASHRHANAVETATRSINGETDSTNANSHIKPSLTQPYLCTKR